MAAALVLGLYALTLAPTTALWDASEYIATAYILGIPHPPGNPLFVVLGRVWILLLEPTGLPVAVRVNLLAAVTSAGAAFFWFLVAHRLLAPALGVGRRALVGAGVAVLLSATAYTVWNQSNVNEKVYTLSVLVIAAVTWLGLRWRDRAGCPGSERYLLLAGYLMVLGTTNHLMSLLPAPALALLVLTSRPGVLLRVPFLARALPLVLLGLSFNLFLPIRAAQDPVINEGDPACEGVGSALVAVWSNGATGCGPLAYNLRREQYGKPPVTERMAPLSRQLLNWYQYFDWQWARGLDPSELPGTARTPFTLLFLGLGGAGLWVVARHDRRGALYLGVLTATLTVGLVYYLNFRYGYSLAPEVANRELHEVRERDYFFIAGFGLWGVLAGMGLAAIWNGLSRAARGRGAQGLTAIVLALALLPLALNWRWASRAGDYAARDWAYDFLVSVEPYALLFTNGDNDTFPLWYLQEVEGIRRDVTVIVGQYLHTDWYPRQLADLTRPGRQRPYDPAAPGSLFPDRAPPTRPITRLDGAELDRVRGGVLGADQTFPFPELAVTFPEGMSLNRASWLTLRFILDSHDERPVYFTSQFGALSDLGLHDFAVRHGLVHRLDVRPLDGEPRPGLVQGSPEFGGEWFDLAHSLRLWEEAYSFRGLRDRDVWFDRATLNIPWHFYALALQLSDAARVAGEPDERVRALEGAAQDFAVVAAGGRRGIPERTDG
ncbi:MAG: DUF2723 domain-containing protein [Longimicrobiales bacterium]|nr:DUF2723 domain-containing protein [Longimicrobiales bacterium]